MSELKTAKQSPRMESGQLCWYRGDTFTLYLKLSLADQDDQPITLTREDLVNLTFLDRNDRTLREFTFNGSQVTGNTVELNVDPELSALFTPGAYRLDVRVVHGNRVTIVKDSPIKVE